MKRSRTRAHLVAPIVITEGPVVEKFVGGGFRWGPRGGEIIFPGHPEPHIVVIGRWPGREPLVEEIGNIVFASCRSLRPQTRLSRVYEIHLLLKWLAQWDQEIKVKSSGHLDDVVITAYLKWLTDQPLSN